MKVTKRVFFEILKIIIKSFSNDNFLGLHLLGLGQALIAVSLIITNMMIWEISELLVMSVMKKPNIILGSMTGILMVTSISHY